MLPVPLRACIVALHNARARTHAHTHTARAVLAGRKLTHRVLHVSDDREERRQLHVSCERGAVTDTEQHRGTPSINATVIAPTTTTVLAPTASHANCTRGTTTGIGRDTKRRKR